MYQLSDIKWVKNIKRENGTDWAYMEDSDLPEFDLHFSIKKKASANTGENALIDHSVALQIDHPELVFFFGQRKELFG